MQIKTILQSAAIAAIVSFGMNLSDIKPSSHSYNDIAPASGDKSAIEKGVIKCGYVSYAPYVQHDPKTGELVGASIDMMEEIGKKLGVDIEWSEEVGWGTMIEGLKAGRYDAVCSPVWQNTARALHVDFTEPFGYARVDAWVRSDDDRFSGELEEFNTDTITFATMDGEMSAMMAAERFPKAQTFSAPNNAPFSDLFLNVSVGKADVIIAETKTAQDFLKSNPGSLKNATQSSPLTTFPVTMLLNKGDDDLRSLINIAQSELIYTGKIETIFNAHGLNKDLLSRLAPPYMD